ncbi:cobalt/nickel transport system ATP-binding protein [Desulfitispora alkaliphila]|uniref:energy-coupling factor ABC transporter ATP-binding protein n=1 Tax=Desulfitispora alkaliphila TaxID=622674 RepID=UPI003D1C9F3B
MKSIVRVKCLKHIYPDKTEVQLHGSDFIVNKGERVAVLGSNGAGKTTLLSHILGLLVPREGSVEVMGLNPNKSFSTIRKKVSVVFQNVDEQIIGPRVYDDIAFTLRNDLIPKEEIEQRVLEVARSIGIENILDKIPHYLSLGQKKKVALAGAIVTKPELLVLDEPFDSLDPKSKREMVQLLNRLNKSQGTALIVTTHDINLVADIADTIYVISKGVFMTKGTPEEVFSQIESLKKANIEPPILVELFTRLRDRGFDLSIPFDVEKAEAELVNYYSNQAVEERYNEANKCRAAT